MLFLTVSSLLISVSLAQTYDFSKFPPPDQPPPINPAWSQHYGLGTNHGYILMRSQQNSSLPPVKAPANSLEYPLCPTADVGLSGCDWSCWNCTRPDDITQCNDKGDWALTYDDGPSNNSLIILDELKKTNTKATFCVVGSRIPMYPQILKKMYDDGHQICVHTWSHRYLTSQTDDQIVAEMEWTIQAVQVVLGVRPTMARPPFGDIDDRVRNVFRKMKLSNLIWNRDTYDWKLNTPAYNFQKAWVLGNFTNWVRESGNYQTGVISLQHDLYSMSVSEAPSALNLVQKAGFNLKTVSDCYPIKAYTDPAAPPNTTTPTDFSQTPGANKNKTNSAVGASFAFGFLSLIYLFL